MLSRRQMLIKRSFDAIVAAVVVVTAGWLIALLALIARWSTGGSGLFRQTRIGLAGATFDIFKIRTMRLDRAIDTTVTTAGDPRITRAGAILRRTKLDELPQFFNVLKGEMSLVGPRPDVAECVDVDSPRGRMILSVPPGITGPATLVFRDEEALLAAQPDPEAYNRTELLPTKARINEHYVRTWRFSRDLRYLALTVLGRTLTEAEAMR
jgi:lipopolysaccharide/colanic/teichoic acid biosynthesis glycosyltransferase